KSLKAAAHVAAVVATTELANALMPASRRSDVAAEGDERLDRVRDEAGRLDRCRKHVRPRRRGCVAPVGPDVRLHDAAAAPVGRAEPRSRASLEPRVPDVELAPGRRLECGLAHRRASATACAIVAASATENIATTVPGRFTTTTAGSGSTPVFAIS